MVSESNDILIQMQIESNGSKIDLNETLQAFSGLSESIGYIWISFLIISIDV